MTFFLLGFALGFFVTVAAVAIVAVSVDAAYRMEDDE